MENLNYYALAAKLEMFARETFGEHVRFVKAEICSELQYCNVEVVIYDGRRLRLTLEDITEEDDDK